MILYLIMNACAISTHTPVRVWHDTNGKLIDDITISTHTPVRVWHHPHLNFEHIYKFQLTHPWGCDNSPVKNKDLWKISTHTPVRVWHVPECSVLNDNCISTHTPVRVWRQEMAITSNILGFQLTHPWGCDIRPFNKQSCGEYFNSHTREGVTGEIFFTSSVLKFQLTHPWGCDIFLMLT